jgi:exosome complex component RRP41
MYDLVVACAAGKVDGTMVLDLSDIEDKEGEADMPVAVMPNLNTITLLQLDGVLTHEEFKRGIDLALSGCRKLYEAQRKALMERYFKGGLNQQEEVE